MAEYFFPLRSSDGVVPDQEGMDLADKASMARVEVAGARDVMKGEIDEGRLSLLATIEVDDELGRPVLTVRFKDVIKS